MQPRVFCTNVLAKCSRAPFFYSHVTLKITPVSESYRLQLPHGPRYRTGHHYGEAHQGGNQEARTGKCSGTSKAPPYRRASSGSWYSTFSNIFWSSACPRHASLCQSYFNVSSFSALVKASGLKAAKSGRSRSRTRGPRSGRSCSFRPSR
jgi:hypothetical protein